MLVYRSVTPFPIAFLDFQVGRNLNQAVNNIHFHQYQEEHLEHSGIVFSRVFPNLSVHRSHDYNTIKHQALFLVLVHILLPLLTDLFSPHTSKESTKVSPFVSLSDCQAVEGTIGCFPSLVLFVPKQVWRNLHCVQPRVV